MRALCIALVLAACGGSSPATRYYQLAPPARAAGTSGGPTLSVEPLSTDGAYDDERIVYRTSPYRLDYYDYHRWSAPPGSLIGNYLEQAFSRSGRFRAVMREGGDASAVVLGGRVVALEEVDRSKTQWVGRIAIELTLTDSASGKLLWSDQYEETEPLLQQTPEGLARAISTAMARIVERAVPAVAQLAEKQAEVHEARATRVR